MRIRHRQEVSSARASTRVRLKTRARVYAFTAVVCKCYSQLQANGICFKSARVRAHNVVRMWRAWYLECFGFSLLWNRWTAVQNVVLLYLHSGWFVWSESECVYVPIPRPATMPNLGCHGGAVFMRWCRRNVRRRFAAGPQTIRGPSWCDVCSSGSINDATGAGWHHIRAVCEPHSITNTPTYTFVRAPTLHALLVWNLWHSLFG